MYNINFNKNKDKLIPVIIQDINTYNVLMLGYMNKLAYINSLLLKKVVFYSRSKKRLWIKGESSLNFLYIKKIYLDCDNDTLLILVIPNGLVCHLNKITCWGNNKNFNFLPYIENIIENRLRYSNKLNKNKSYIYKLYKKGNDRIIQKFGEESIEYIIAFKNKNNIKLIIEEASDLLFHFIISLKFINLSFNNIILNLIKRHNKK